MIDDRGTSTGTDEGTDTGTDLPADCPTSRGLDVDGTTVELSATATSFHGDYWWESAYYVDERVVRRTGDEEVDPRNGTERNGARVPAVGLTPLRCSTLPVRHQDGPGPPPLDGRS